MQPDAHCTHLTHVGGITGGGGRGSGEEEVRIERVGKRKVGWRGGKGRRG